MAVGRTDIPLARLVEGHVDALRILAQAGSPPPAATANESKLRVSPVRPAPIGAYRRDHGDPPEVTGAAPAGSDRRRDVTAGMMAVAVVLALVAAACFGSAGYLQHASARRAPQRGPLRPRLLIDLLSDRRFAGSLALSVVAFGGQVAALHLAPLALVQPLLATQLLCYLGLVTVRHHRRPDTVLLGGALLATMGLIGFLLVSRPTSPPPGTQIGGQTALIAGVGLTVLTAAALAIGSRLRSEWRAVPFAVACAVFYGVTAALVRSLVGGGVGLDIFTHWELYAIAVVAPMGFLLNQNAFQNGMFGSVAVAIITVGDPAVSIGLGAVWLDESLAGGWPWTLAQVLTLIGMAGGVLALAHRAQVLAERGRQLESSRPAARVVES